MHISERYTKQPKKIRRFTIRGLLFLGVYSTIIRNLLFQGSILRSGIYLLLGMLVLLFLVLDFDLFAKKYIRIGIGVFMLLSAIIFFLLVQFNTNTIIAFILLNLGFVVLIHSKDIMVFNAWRYFTGGGYMFSFFIALAYSFFIIGTTSTYKVDCEKMYGSIDSITKQIQGEHLGEENLTQSRLTSQNDEMGHPEGNEGSSMQKLDSSALPLNDKKSRNSLSSSTRKNTKDKTLLGGFLTAGKEVLTDIGLSKKNLNNTRDQILVEINELGNGLVDSTKGLWNEINDNRKALSVSACKYLGKQIGFLYQNTYFQLALVILMSLVFVGVIRLLTWIITIVAYLLFKILQLLGVYQVKKAEKMVDTVE